MKRIAIVTGASSGMGADFVRQLASRPDLDEIWAVARRSERLAALAAELRSPEPDMRAKARIVPIAADLTKGGAERVRARLESEAPELRLLVLNAGAGRFATFEDSSREDSLGMIDLNIRALTEMAKDALPYLGTGAGMILVASLAGLGPMGNIAVYAATKAYVISFGVAIAEELRSRGIGVTILCPGPVRTEFDRVASKGRSEGMRGTVPAALVVRRCLRAFHRRRRFAFGHWTWALAPFALRLLSRRFLARSAMRIMR
ncbi:MAG TPA: SDR family NAD(P)-dependent oxidoreductase [Rectinemataceae bacterium]|nr:SDR family NAD(P)-dependent oxidoreductase [Rectinemataceae bacterium]